MNKKIFFYILILLGLFFFLKYPLFFMKNTSKNAPKINIRQKPTSTPSLKKTDIITTISTPYEVLRQWTLSPLRQKSITLTSGERDPEDNLLIARGVGKVILEKNGEFILQGDAPRLYVYDENRNQKWNNVEAVFYGMRVSESKSIQSQGFVIGARSEHQDVTDATPCLGRTYYGRLLYDGRAVFQKELIHEGAYSSNKPTENNKTKWDTPDGTMPYGIWIGVKFIVKTQSDGKSVKLELYKDLSQKGNWEKVAEYLDTGEWSQTDTNADIKSICGFPANKVLTDPGTSVFIRNDYIKEARYKEFSIKEIR